MKQQCCRSVPQGMKQGVGNGGLHSSAPERSSASHRGGFQGRFSQWKICHPLGFKGNNHDGS